MPNLNNLMIKNELRRWLLKTLNNTRKKRSHSMWSRRTERRLSWPRHPPTEEAQKLSSPTKWLGSLQPMQTTSVALTTVYAAKITVTKLKCTVQLIRQASPFNTIPHRQGKCMLVKHTKTQLQQNCQPNLATKLSLTNCHTKVDASTH
jgi:hypothetical protein